MLKVRWANWLELCLFTFVLQPRSKPGDESYDPYDWDSDEEAEDVADRRKTRSSAKSAPKPTSVTEMETEISAPDDAAAGPSAESASPAVITDDR
jgi:hypothetical protein